MTKSVCQQSYLIMSFKYQNLKTLLTINIEKAVEQKNETKFDFYSQHSIVLENHQRFKRLGL